MIDLLQYYPVLSASNTANTLLVFGVKLFSERTHAALGLFNAALLPAAKQSSTGSSQARKCLCTSLSQEKKRDGGE